MSLPRTGHCSPPNSANALDPVHVGEPTCQGGLRAAPNGGSSRHCLAYSQHLFKPSQNSCLAWRSLLSLSALNLGNQASLPNQHGPVEVLGHRSGCFPALSSQASSCTMYPETAIF